MRMTALDAVGSVAVATENSTRSDVTAQSSSRWIFTQEQLLNTPSVREGMDPEEELKRRRVAAQAIHQMADRLNRDSRVRISQLCICAAMMYMHRFFVFHSFYKFDPKDIAATCLFLAGKSEECPRKLEHIVFVWWAIKFPHTPKLEANRYHDAVQLIVTLENVILQTIAFDLSVDIPHTFVLSHMQNFASGNRKISEIAYWFASDTLHMTNWAVRFPARSIACVCIRLACLWGQFELPPGSPPWYEIVDPTMTSNRLLEMAEEFSHIYKTYGEHLNIKNYAMRNLAANAAQNSQEQVRRKLHFQPRSQEEASQSLPSLSAPPPAPDLTVTAVKTELRSKPARRIGLGDYKQLYVKAVTASTGAQNASQLSGQRHNFMHLEKRLLTPHPEEEMRQKRRGKGLEGDSVKRRPPENADKLLSDEPSSQHQTRENERAAVNVEHEGTPSAPPSNHHRLPSSLSPGSQQSRRSSNEPEAALRSSCSSDLLVHGACSPGAVDPANFSTASSNHRMSMENGGRLSRSAGSSIYPRRPPRPHTSPSLQTPLNRAYPNLCTTPSPSNHNFACCSGNHGSRPGCRSPMAIKRRFMIFRRQADVRSHNRNGGGDCGSRGHRTWCPGAIGYRYNYRNDRHNSWNEPWRHSNHNYKSFQGGFQQCRFRSGIRWGRTNDTDSLKQAVDVSYNTSPPALPAAQPFVFEFSSASPSCNISQMLSTSAVPPPPLPNSDELEDGEVL